MINNFIYCQSLTLEEVANLNKEYLYNRGKEKIQTMPLHTGSKPRNHYIKLILGKIAFAD